MRAEIRENPAMGAEVLAATFRRLLEDADQEYRKREGKPATAQTKKGGMITLQCVAEKFTQYSLSKVHIRDYYFACL